MDTISCKSIKSSNSSSEKCRNWLELPWDVTRSILIKSGTFEMLETAQFVCKLWYNLCKDPSLWRTIHINDTDEMLEIDPERMMLHAFDRSAGGLIALSIENFGSDEFLSSIVSRWTQLKCLRLARCRYISAKAVTDAVQKLSSLEELELTLCSFGKKTIHIINSCHSLSTFKLNKLGSRGSYWACDKEAFAIAESMPRLRHLQLIGNDMTDVGLNAILDGCRQLESLDLRGCFHINVVGKLEQRLSQQIKVFRHPNDSTADYNYDVEDPQVDYVSDTYFALPSRKESY